MEAKTVKHTLLFRDYAIRDILPHLSDVADWIKGEALTLWIENTHNQDLSIEVLGNIYRSSVGALTVIAAFTVAAGTKAYRTLTPRDPGWLPYILVKATAAAAPTKGFLNILALEKP